MSKKQKIILFSVLSFVLAVITGIAIFIYCNSQKAFIYCFKDNYKAGTKITKDMFESMKVDSKIVESGKESSVNTYYLTGKEFDTVINANEYLLNDVAAKQPFTLNDLALEGGTSIERSLSDNKKAVSIAISGTAAVTDDLRVGSIVDIYSVDSDRTEMLFENMKIIDRNDDENVSTVTFAVTPADAIQLINAANNKKLYFSLKAPISNEKEHSGSVYNSETDSSLPTDTNNTDNNNSKQ